MKGKSKYEKKGGILPKFSCNIILRDLTMQVHILQDRYLRAQSFRLWSELSLAKTKVHEYKNKIF